MSEQNQSEGTSSEIPLEFRRNDELHRYEALVGSDVASYAEFVLARPARIVFTHTVSQPGYGGRGIATHLVEWALTDARDRGERIVPKCPFVVSYLTDHRQFDDALELH